jgi:hypothetical protein
MVKKLRKVVIKDPDEKHKNNKKKKVGPIKPPRKRIKTA